MTIRQMLQAQLEVLDNQEKRLQVLEGTNTHIVPMLSEAQQKEIRDLIGSVTEHFLGSRKTAARINFKYYLDIEIIQDVKTAFDVNTFDKIPCTKFMDVIRYVRNWELNEEYKELR